jgi:hypothetical protein
MLIVLARVQASRHQAIRSRQASVKTEWVYARCVRGRTDGVAASKATNGGGVTVGVHVLTKYGNDVYCATGGPGSDLIMRFST